MIVQIQRHDANESAPEWAMIELNGELVAPTEAPRSEMDENCNGLIGKDRVELGSLRFTLEGKPIMVLGSHELKGEVVALKEPFCVMKKRKRQDEAVEYNVVGTVTKKLLFNQYPKSIMSQIGQQNDKGESNEPEKECSFHS